MGPPQRVRTWRRGHPTYLAPFQRVDVSPPGAGERRPRVGHLPGGPKISYLRSVPLRPAFVARRNRTGAARVGRGQNCGQGVSAMMTLTGSNRPKKPRRVLLPPGSGTGPATAAAAATDPWP